MPTEEAFQHVSQLRRDGCGIKCKHPLDDMIRTRLVCWIEIARFSGRLERANHYARGVGTQVQGLPVEKRAF